MHTQVGQTQAHIGHCIITQFQELGEHGVHSVCACCRVFVRVEVCLNVCVFECMCVCVCC